MAKDQDKFDREMLELAIQTRNWARRMGCFIDSDESDEKKHGYFTVAEWTGEFQRPKYLWKFAKKKLIAMGEPITIDSFGGHYWGKPGDQAKNTIMLISRASTMLETAMYQLQAMQGTSEWEQCIKKLESGLSESRHQFKLDDVPVLLNGAGLNPPDEMIQDLLPSGE